MKTKKTTLLRNIGWIALVAVWSFLAGAYFHLGWVRDHSINFLTGFIIGGIGVWIVFSAMGIFVYRFAKSNGNPDPAKPALMVVSFFTVCFLLIAWVKFDDVNREKFVEDLEYSFVRHYTDKAAEKGLEIEELHWELTQMYTRIDRDLVRHPQLEQLMQLKTAEAVFEENRIIAELCLAVMESHREIGSPPAAGMQELFE